MAYRVIGNRVVPKGGFSKSDDRLRYGTLAGEGRDTVILISPDGLSQVEVTMDSTAYFLRRSYEFWIDGDFSRYSDWLDKQEEKNAKS